MFSSIPSRTYIQNNYFGSRGYQTPNVCGNNFLNGSLFGIGFNCRPSYPSFGFNYFNYIPSYPMFGGYCGGYSMYNFAAMNRMLDMFTMLNTFNATTNTTKNFFNSFSTLTAPRRTSSAQAASVAAVKNAPISIEVKSKSLEDIGYNSEKGSALAKTVANNAVGFTNRCAGYVRQALDKTGLGTGVRGDGYEYASILSNNPNFKEVSTKNLNLSSLPAGCVLVYDRGVAGYSRQYGHVEVTLGNGQAVSDGVTNNIRNGARVFVPV